MNTSLAFVRNSELFASSVDNELVMMDESQGKYFGLNPVARTIWELLETPMHYDDILGKLTARYDVPVETCEKEVRPFLEKMIEHKLIHTVGE